MIFVHQQVTPLPSFHQQCVLCCIFQKIILACCTFPRVRFESLETRKFFRSDKVLIEVTSRIKANRKAPIKRPYPYSLPAASSSYNKGIYRIMHKLGRLSRCRYICFHYYFTKSSSSHLATSVPLLTSTLSYLRLKVAYK